MGTEPPGEHGGHTDLHFDFHSLRDCGTSRRKGVFSRLARTPDPAHLCGPLLPSPLRKDKRSGRPPGPSAGGSCPNSSTPSGSDFPGFSFGFCKIQGSHWHCAGPHPQADRGHTLADLHPVACPHRPSSAPFSWRQGCQGAKSQVPAGGDPRPPQGGTRGIKS